jgi:two-component system LytT family response regulator
VREYLAAYPDLFVVAECGDGFEGLKAIQQHKPALVILDIQMPKINGFEMLELLEEPPPVIFTTAFDEYAIKAFEASAIDYLLKPFSKDRFEKAVQRWRRQPAPERQQQQQELLHDTSVSQAQQERVVVRQGTHIRIIPVHDVLYFEAADDYVKLHTPDGSYLKNKTMGYFEKLLDTSQFVRVHRSYIVSVQQISRIDPYEKESYLALLKNGQRVPVSKSGYARLREVLGM